MLTPLTLLSVPNGLFKALGPLVALVALVALALATLAPPQLNGQAQAPLPPYVIEEFGTPPPIPTQDLAPEIGEAATRVFIDAVTSGGWGSAQIGALEALAGSQDARLAWPISDLMRFVSDPALNADLSEAASTLLGIELNGPNSWGALTDHLIAWDVPAPPQYLSYKRAIFTSLVPGWEDIFVPGNIDWRHVSWGGVLIDDRPFDTTDEPCNCIPAADNPRVTSAEQATWLDDDDIVFGIEINGEARAYPRQIMEVREMVNDSLGGRDLGIPYCTLCGAAQAYFTDALPDGITRPVLRTSGLLIRSNKVMYDVNSYSVFDTFLGHAVTGPLAEIGVQLTQAPVITTSWGRWKQAHPDTTVLAEALALGRDFDFRNNRDANGPIFPIGDLDPRLPVHEDVIGVISPSGKPIAFQQSKAMVTLIDGTAIELNGVRLVLAAGGIKAVDDNGQDLGSHQAFWFAWSQFHPETVLWQGT